MSVNVDRLIHMANQIGHFFEAQPDRLEAVAGVVDHLRRFWDPHMRAALVAHGESGGHGLSELVAEAVRKLAAESATQDAVKKNRESSL